MDKQTTMDKLNVFDDANDIVIMFNEERIRIKKTYFDKLLIDLNTLSRKLAQENQKSYNKAKQGNWYLDKQYNDK